MKRATLLTLVCFAFTACATTTTHQGPTHGPPIAKKEIKELTTHGHTRIDEYYWMRDDKRQDPQILAHLAAENTYTDSQLAPLTSKIDSLFSEIKSRIAQDDSTVPARKGGHLYWRRFEKGREYAIHCRRSVEDDKEVVILDENERAKGHEYYRAGVVAPSPSGNLLAIAEDTVSRRVYTLRFRDLKTGKFLADEITGVGPAAVWSSKDSHVFYIRKEEGTLREYQVWRHEMGTSADKDVLVYEEKDSEFYSWVDKTRSGDFIVISSEQTLSSEYRVIPADAPTTAPKVFLSREAKHEYSIAHDTNRWLIRTNWKATNFRVMTADLKDSANKETWQELVGASDEIFVRGVDAFEDFVIIQERRGGLPGLQIIPKKDGAPWSVAFEEPVYSARLGTNHEYSTKTLRYRYTSLTTPSSVFDYDIATRTSTLRKENPVLGGFDKTNYVAKRVWVKATDGTKVPVSIVHRKDLDRTQPNPLYLYGYGSYGASLDPWFSAARLSLLDRGFIYAVAHIRGGQELGRHWYENGKLLHKRNTFTDFIDCADELVRGGYTTKEKLTVSGGSAGGLLIGAVINMRPDLFSAAIARVPFVDVVTTMLDESIPLTTFEYDEWGNPNTKKYYEYMLSYSPYDNVGAHKYPALFVFTGLHDSQVQYWEPAKWVARLRERSIGDAPLLFKVNMEAGHGGSSGRFKKYKEIAIEYAWLLNRFGVVEDSSKK
jgi:oligopeptidase B